VREGADSVLGIGTGGSMGIPANAHGFAVEFDTYWNGGWPNEPSGYNNLLVPFVHVGINNLSWFSSLTNIDHDPA